MHYDITANIVHQDMKITTEYDYATGVHKDHIGAFVADVMDRAQAEFPPDNEGIKVALDLTVTAY